MPRPYHMQLEHRGVGTTTYPTNVSQLDPNAMDNVWVGDYGLTYNEMQSALKALNNVPTTGGDFTGNPTSLISSLANPPGGVTVGGFFQQYGIWILVGGLGLLLLRRR